MKIAKGMKIQDTKKTYIYFSLIVISNILFTVLYQWHPFFTGEPFDAEVLIDFFARSDESIKQLFYFDFVYFSIPQRIITYLVHLLNIPINFIPIVYSCFQITIPVLISSVFCLPRFRSVIQDDFLRFFICIIITFTKSLEISSFTNFTYYAFPLFLYLLLDGLSNKSKTVPTYGYVGILFIFSKIFHLSILPLMIFAFPLVNKEYKKFFSACIISGLIVICFSDTFSHLLGAINSNQASESTLAFRARYFITFSLNHITSIITSSRNLILNDLSITPILLLPLTLIIFIITVYLKIKSFFRYLPIFGLILVFINVFIFAAGWPSHSFYEMNDLTLNRHTAHVFYSKILIVLGLVFCAFEYFSIKDYRLRRLILIGFFIINGYLLQLVKMNTAYTDLQVLSWNNNVKRGSQDSYCTIAVPFHSYYLCKGKKKILYAIEHNEYNYLNKSNYNAQGPVDKILNWPHIPYTQFNQAGTIDVFLPKKLIEHKVTDIIIKFRISSSNQKETYNFRVYSDSFSTKRQIKLATKHISNVAIQLHLEEPTMIQGRVQLEFEGPIQLPLNDEKLLIEWIGI